jgi:hypothetical protein
LRLLKRHDILAVFGSSTGAVLDPFLMLVIALGGFGAAAVSVSSEDEAETIPEAPDSL